MKFERNFSTNESSLTAYAKISRYLEDNGYKQGESRLVFERGSRFGSYASFSTKKWKVVVTLKINSNPDYKTDVNVSMDINTNGQIVSKKEKIFWQNELAGLIASVSGFDIDVPLINKLDEKLRLEKRHKEGSKWFYFIGGLSLVNSIAFLAGGSFNFLVGLGITQVIDGISYAVINEVNANAGLIIQIIAFMMDLIIAGIFVLLGVLARKHRWSFVVGIIFYTLDALLFLMVPDYLSIVFHLIALAGLFSGLRASGQLIRDQTPAAQEVLSSNSIQQI